MIQDNVPSLIFISKSFTLYTRLLFLGLQPLWGSGVTSSIEAIRKPTCCKAEIADSRQEPGPFTLISISLTPLRIAMLAQLCAACWAAKGVLLREPLNPTQPAELEQIVLPSKSVMVTSVLLKVALIWATAFTTFFLIFRFVKLLNFPKITLDLM